MIGLWGGMGSIGRRYQAILRELRIPFKVIDTANQQPLPNFADDILNVKKAIIATPTETHFTLAMYLQNAGIPFLCEKPLSKLNNELKDYQKFYTPGFVVNNYNFITAPKMIDQIEYDFFNTGRDGLLWDVCQLVQLSQIHGCDLIVRRRSSVWRYLINDIRIPYDQVEKSYSTMIKAFYDDDREKLWPLSEGIEMSKLVLKLESSLKKELTDEGFVRRSGQVKLETIIEQDLPSDRRQVPSRLGV